MKLHTYSCCRRAGPPHTQLLPMSSFAPPPWKRCASALMRSQGTWAVSSVAPVPRPSGSSSIPQAGVCFDVVLFTHRGTHGSQGKYIPRITHKGSPPGVRTLLFGGISDDIPSRALSCVRGPPWARGAWLVILITLHQAMVTREGPAR